MYAYDMHALIGCTKLLTLKSRDFLTSIIQHLSSTKAQSGAASDGTYSTLNTNYDFFTSKIFNYIHHYHSR